MEYFLVKNCAVGLTALAVLSGPVHSSGIVEEVLVTAQKREENLQKVPITVSAFSENILRDVSVDTTDDLTQMVPGLQMSRTLSSSTPFIRGVGTDSNLLGDEGAVGTYVDGIFVGSSIASVQTFNNVDRVEVLKGPQGTLFGRNTTGGVIQVITKNPEFETSGDVRISYGNYDTARFNFYATTGLSDNVAVDLAAYVTEQGEGYGLNVATGKSAHLTDLFSIRNKWRVHVNEDFSALVTLDYSKRESSAGIQRRQMAGTVGLLGDTFSGDFHDVSEDLDSFGEVEEMGFALKLEKNFKVFDLVSITSYRETVEEQILDIDASLQEIIHVDFPSGSETFVQEFQLLSTTDSSLEWQIGLFYMDNEQFYDPTSRFFGLAFAGLGLEEQIVSAELGTESYAAYAQGTYSFTDTTRLTLGARYTHDKRDRKGSIDFTLPGDTPAGSTPLAGSETFTEPTWRVALDHDLSEDALLYASYSRGFKSGVFGSLDAGGAVEPEFVDAYEVGFKASLMDGRMRFNGAAFWYEYDDMQLQVVTGTLAETTNAGKSRIRGAEIEWLFNATENLDLYANASFLDTEFKKYDGATVNVPDTVTGMGNTTLVFDARGNELPQAPDYTVSVGGIYYVQLGESGQLKLNANYYYNDGFFWDALNADRGTEDNYSLLNAGITWVSPSEDYEVRLSGANLTDEEYAVYYGILPYSEFFSPAPPRTYRLEFKYSF